MALRLVILLLGSAAGVAWGDLIPGYYNSPVKGSASSPAVVAASPEPEGGEQPPAVKPKDKVSIGLKMASDQQNKAFITNGDVPVERGMVTPIGKNVAGTDTILAFWDETPGALSSIQVIWTTVNGEPFLPVGHTLNGKPANLIEWRVGATDPIEFMKHITEIKLTKATISWSSNGGASFQTTSIFQFFSNPWDGIDIGKMLPLAGVNYMFTIYEFEAIPAPGSLGLLALAGALASRRRR